jgi:hypothetical protein
MLFPGSDSIKESVQTSRNLPIGIYTFNSNYYLLLMRILISFVISALACLALSGSGEDSQMVHVLDQESVLKVTGIQYDGHSYRASKYNWLIMFQVSWCEVCKATLPTWMQLADTLTKHVNSDRKFHQTRMAVVDWYLSKLIQ